MRARRERAQESERIQIYTDGGADPNPGRGGWGAVILRPGTELSELSGGEPETTNNRMELTAAICGLRALDPGSEVDLHTDSQYVRRGVTEWLPGWIGRGWQRKGGEIKNLDLWRELQGIAARHDVRWHWVKGHSGNRYNDRADALATAAIHAGRPRGEAGSNERVGEPAVFLRVSADGRHGAWAALRQADGDDAEVRTGVVMDETSNRLDLVAACETLESLPAGTGVAIHTLSDYLRNGASQWLSGWRARGFITKEGSPVKNADLWRRLESLLLSRTVSWPRPDRDLPTWGVLEKALKDALAKP